MDQKKLWLPGFLFVSPFKREKKNILLRLNLDYLNYLD